MSKGNGYAASELIRSRGILPYQIARHVGVSHAAARNWCLGIGKSPQPTKMNHIELLAGLLDCRPEEIRPDLYGGRHVEAVAASAQAARRALADHGIDVPHDALRFAIGSLIGR